jgi:hypothetical protein
MAEEDFEVCIHKCKQVAAVNGCMQLHVLPWRSLSSAYSIPARHTKGDYFHLSSMVHITNSCWQHKSWNNLLLALAYVFCRCWRTTKCWFRA